MLMNDTIKPTAARASPALARIAPSAVTLAFSLQPLALVVWPSFREAQLISTAFQREITRNNAKKKEAKPGTRQTIIIPSKNRFPRGRQSASPFHNILGWHCD
jgi:hypothetical protein